jgi:hypothetical protein
MAEIIQFPARRGGQSGGDGSGPFMLEHRVARLEDDMKEVKASLRSIENKVNSIAESVAEIRGRIGGLEIRLSAVPTTVQMVTWLIATWGAGAAMVFTLPRFAPK